MRAMAIRDPQARDRTLERALLFNFVIHGVAMLGMVALLGAYLPGSSGSPDDARIALIAQHPWRFRLGWLPWQLCAVGDLWLALAMVRTPWLPRRAATAVVLLTIAAVIPDQYAQAQWITRGVWLAQHNRGAYLAFEQAIFPLTAGWGALFYTLGGLGWTWCFARATAPAPSSTITTMTSATPLTPAPSPIWSREISLLSAFLWPTMLLASVSALLVQARGSAATFLGLVNAVGFLQLQCWLGLVTEQILRRARPFEATGRLARWRHPARGPLPRLLELLANSRLCHALMALIPKLSMRSEITDVVYVSYLVPAEVLLPLVPPELALQRLGPEGAYALFTFLTYRHGHFGVAALGPLRKVLFPSPVQSNWRIHVTNPHTGHRGITFVTNAIANTPLALAARLMTEGMPMHVFARARLSSTGGALSLHCDPGQGSAPDVELTLREAAAPAWTGAWTACFAGYEAFLAYCVPQDRALSSQPSRRRISRQEIDLAIPLAACVPLEGEVTSRAARAIVGEAQPLCFTVPKVQFSFSAEAHDHY